MKQVINPQYASFRDFVVRIPEIFDTSGEMLRDIRNVIKRFRVGDTLLVVKRYKTPTAFNRVVYTFLRSTKAERAYRYALRLTEMGFDTPAPVGYVEMKSGGLFKTGYFISLNTDCPSMTEGVARYPEPEALALTEAFMRFTVELHEAGVLHNDYNLANILYRRQEDGTYRFSLIDNNRMRFARRLSRRACLDNFRFINAEWPVYLHIALLYADLRGWSVPEVLRGVVEAKMRIERKLAVKRKLLGFLRGGRR